MSFDIVLLRVAGEDRELNELHVFPVLHRLHVR